MFRTAICIFFSGLLLVGCSDPKADSSIPLSIERDYETIHEEGLGTLRFFEPRQLGENLWAMCFQVPPTFLNGGSGADGDATADPFAAPFLSITERKSKPDAQKVLEEAGITFGPDHFARHYPENSALVAVLPIEQLELVEAYMSSIGQGPPRPLSIYAEVYEVEEAFHLQLRKSVKQEADHTPERDALFTAAKLGECSLEEAIVVRTLSGSRAKTEQLENGSKLEIDPVLGTDERTIELLVRYWNENRTDGVVIETDLLMEVQKYVAVSSWKVAAENPPRYRHLLIKVEAPEQIR